MKGIMERSGKMAAVVLAFALVCTSLVVLAGCSGGTSSSQSSSATSSSAKADKKLIVAMELAYPPFETKDDAGDPSGLSVDFMKDFEAANA